MDILKEQIAEVMNVIKEQNALSQISSLIKDNKIEFSYQDKQYRVRKPTTIETDRMTEFRAKEYFQILSNGNFKFKAQIIDLLKKQGINLTGIERSIKDIHYQIKGLYERLAETDPTDEKSREALTEEIEKSQIQEAEWHLKEYGFLELSIENQLHQRVDRFLTYQVLEICEDGKWVKAFSSYDDMLAANDGKLIETAYQYVVNLLGSNAYQ
jgi:hypothetical protein